MPNRREFLATGATLGVAGLLNAGGAARSAEAAPIVRQFGPRMKLSLAAYSLRSKLPTSPNESELAQAKLTLDGFIDYCAKLGLDGTELTAYYFPQYVQRAELAARSGGGSSQTNGESADSDRAKAIDYLNALKNRAFRLGLDISGTAIGNNFCLPKGPDRDAQINLCKSWIDRASLLGAPVIRIFAGRVPESDSKDNAIKRCAAAIDECLAHAARRGVFLALENHGGITADASSMLKIVDSVAPSDWFGVNFDSGNFHSDDPYRDLAKIAPYAVNAQVKVSISRGGKKEPADFARIVGILKDAGYRGYLVLEYEEKADPIREIPKYIDQLRGLIA